MRSAPDVTQRTQARDHQRVRPDTKDHPAEALVPLSAEQRLLVAVLQTQQNGMTVHQIEARLSRPSGEVQSLLESVLERQLVARLNTIVPSYVYRYRGIELHSE